MSEIGVGVMRILHYLRVVKAALFLCIIILLKPLLSRQFRGRNIWLIGENFGNWVGDNGYFFFRHCQEKEGIAPEAFFIARASTISKLRECFPRGSILTYGSLRHLNYLVYARTLFFTHTYRDIIYHALFPVVRRGKRKIFLHHGTLAFKKFNDEYIANAKLPNIAIAVSDEEARLLIKSGVNASTIRITGAPRHDYLPSKVGAGRCGGVITFMPTWRDWLTPDNVLSSVFFKTVSGVIADSDLTSLLKKSNIVLKVYLHVKMQPFIKQFKAQTDVVRVVPFSPLKVHELITQSDALITDYSSVCWDFLYLNKPVLFFPFDLNDYLKCRGSALDYEANLFADAVKDGRALTEAVRALIGRGFSVEKGQEEQRRKWFKYFDSQNCRRVCDEVERLH